MQTIDRQTARAMLALVAIGILILLIPLLIAALGAVDLSISHAVTKHGADALAVRQCLSKNGAMQIWYNPETERRANVCQLEPNKWGMQIIEYGDGVWKEVTAFVKNKFTRFEQVARYLRNAGYQPLQ